MRIVSTCVLLLVAGAAAGTTSAAWAATNVPAPRLAAGGGMLDGLVLLVGLIVLLSGKRR
jgi:hypothetical protein